jgi:hypothetical protein
MRRYVEAMGGTLELVAQFPDRPPMVIDHLPPASSRSNGTLAGHSGKNSHHY